MLNRSFCKLIFLVLVASVLVFSGCQEQKRRPSTASSVVPLPIQNENANAVQLYVDAMMLKELEEWDEAVEKLNEAIQFAPEFSLAYSFKGDVYLLAEEYEKSADSYEVATEIDPWSFKDFSSLGKVSVIIEDYHRAVNAYLSACDLDPNDYGVHLGAGQCFFELEDYDQAFGYGQRSKELGPGFADPDILLGDVFEANGDYTAAVDSYRRAIEIEGNEPKIMVPLAIAYVKMKRYEAAEELLTQTIEIDPENIAAYRYLGFIQLQLYKGNLDIALASYNRAVEIDAEDSMAHKGLGVVYMLKFINSKDDADKLKAVEQWNKSLSINADQPELMKLLSRYAG